VSRFEHHSVKTDESLGRRFVRALDETGESKSDVLREAIVDYVESVEGNTTESIERRIEELLEEKQDIAEKRKRAARQEELKDARIDDLEERLDDLKSDGNYDDLLDEVVGLASRGADLHAINDKTGKLDRLRALGSHESLEEVIQTVNDAVQAGEERC